MSIAQWLGLPDAFVATLLVLITLLALTPYFSGVTIGTLQVPRVAHRKARTLRLAGPLLVVAAVLFVLPISALRPAQKSVRLVAADVTEDGQIDFVVENAGNAAALLTSIEIEVLTDPGIAARPILNEAATYVLPIDDLSAGQSRRRMIRHRIDARSIERIVVALQTTRVLRVRLLIRADEGSVLTADLEHPAMR